MSNFSLSVDLLRFVGAEVCSLDFKGQKRNCIIIPVNWNDIEVKVDNNGKPAAAPVYMRGWETKDSYVKACKERNADNPDYVAPSHTIDLNWREEFMNKAVEAAYKRMKGDPQNASISDEDLKKKALYEVRNKLRVGSMKVLAKREQPTLQGDAAPLNAAPQEFSKEVTTDESDDLPF